MTYSPARYPVTLTFREDAHIGRLWGIPLLGFFVRWIVAIPLFIVLAILGIVMYFAVLLLWIPVLISGRQAGLVYTLVGGYLRYSVRTSAYLFFLAGAYPSLGLAEVPGEDVAVHFDEGQPINHLWGIPILGYVARAILLIPHFLVYLVLGIAAGITLYFTWIPVLVLGRQAAPVYAIVGGWLRYYVRMAAYLLLLNDSYPPFRLGN